MGVEAVKAYFAGIGREDAVMEFALSSATVQLAAQAVGVEAARIAKTLSLRDGEHGMLLVVAGDARIDNAQFRKQFGFKARMLDPEEALRLTGHAVGGVCPFALATPLPVYCDVSLKRFATVFPAAGSDNSAVELEPDALAAMTGAEWVDVCVGWRESV